MENIYILYENTKNTKTAIKAFRDIYNALKHQDRLNKRIEFFGKEAGSEGWYTVEPLSFDRNSIND